MASQNAPGVLATLDYQCGLILIFCHGGTAVPVLPALISPGFLGYRERKPFMQRSPSADLFPYPAKKVMGIDY
jgi:hypothetical protein